MAVAQGMSFFVVLPFHRVLKFWSVVPEYSLQKRLMINYYNSIAIHKVSQLTICWFLYNFFDNITSLFVFGKNNVILFYSFLSNSLFTITVLIKM